MGKIANKQALLAVTASYHFGRLTTRNHLLKYWSLPLALLILSFFGNEAVAQSIGTVTVSGAPVCAGSAVSISFAVTNGNGSSNYFKTSTNYNVFLSNSSGASFTSLGSSFTSSSTPPASSNGATATITISNITIPTSAGGSGYKIAVQST